MKPVISLAKPVHVLLTAFAFAGSPLLRAADTPGIPWTGKVGIVETVDQITARSLTKHHKIKEEREKEKEHGAHGHREDETDPKENPLSPLVSQWPLPTGKVPVPLLPQTVGSSFLGITLGESGAIPPDSMGAAGPSQILVLANGRIRAYNKSGGSGPLNVAADDFFASVADGFGVSDPHVRYDRLSGRWFIVMINVAKHSNRILIAMSNDSTITNSTAFTFFQFPVDFDGGDFHLFADYPTLGVDKFALYVGVNNFLSSDGGMATRAAFVINKASLLSGGPIVVTAFRNLDNDGAGNNMWTPQGVDNDDPDATEGYFIGTDLLTTGKLDIRRISNPGGTPAISPTLTLTVPSTSSPIPQAHRLDSLNKKLDVLGTRLFAAAMHKNKITGSNTLWTAHNLQVDATGVSVSGGGRNGSRWYQIGELTNTPVLIQAGTLFDPATSFAKGYWIPSVAMSGQGHMALGCSYAASNVFAGVATAGRLRDDPPGSTQAPTFAVVSSTAYNLVESGTNHRWGDFSQVVVDPTDDMTMWTFQEYCNAANSWAVRVVQLRAPPPATPVSASPSTLTAGQGPVDLVINGTSIAGSEFFDPGPDTGGPGFPNHISATVNGGGVTLNSITFSNITNITMNVTVSPCAVPGDRTITVLNPDGRGTTSTSPLLTILAGPCIISPPQSQSVAVGSNATFTVTASGTSPLSYQWRYNQVLLPGATNSVYTRSNALCTDAGAYDVIVTNPLGSATSSVATLTIVTAPLISTQPVPSQTITAGQTATFNVAATNDCGDSLAYQWRLEGTNILGATASSYIRTNSQFVDGGSYVVVVSSLAGSVTSSVANLTVLSFPLITQQPQPRSVKVSTDTSFTIIAIGTAPLSYQWRFNQVAIPGASFSSFTRSNVQCIDAGSFDAIVTNAYGSITSSVATLTVVTPPIMTSQPTNQTVFAGQPAGFFAAATNLCGAGLTYQWYFNTNILTDAQTNNLLISNAQSANAGQYALVVTNLAGSLTSIVATLTVIVPPSAAFVAGPANGFVPLTVSFTNLSTGATNYVWDFGNGNTSAEMNPTNLYSGAGAFSVSLTAIGAGGTNTLTRTNYILASIPPSLFALQLSDTNFIFSFPTITDKTYNVQYKASLDEPSWQTLQSLPGDGTVKTITNSTSSASQRFYRLSIQ